MAINILINKLFIYYLFYLLIYREEASRPEIGLAEGESCCRRPCRHADYAHYEMLEHFGIEEQERIKDNPTIKEIITNLFGDIAINIIGTIIIAMPLVKRSLMTMRSLVR